MTTPTTPPNFDVIIDRCDTHCEKYDQRADKFGRADVIPLWVADMDFAAPACVQDAIAERAAHPIFGYSFPAGSLSEAVFDWYRERHNWCINAGQWFLTPGVVPSLFAAVNALTEVGDSILVPSPVYPPFFAAVEKNGRRLVQSPFLKTAAGYELDFDHLEKEAAAGAKMLLLCSPHNPVGRVWTQAELERLIELALRHHLVVVSDDIHCDLVFPGHQHRPLATLAPPELRLLTAISPSKTFNIPGLNMASLVVSHDADRVAVQSVFARARHHPSNPFTLAAFAAAYKDGAGWLDHLLSYLDANRQLVKTRIDAMEGITTQPQQASCLMWLDCHELGLSDSQLQQFFVESAGLGLNPGKDFGLGGSGFMRLNIGTQRALLETALNQLDAALAAR